MRVQLDLERRHLIQVRSMTGHEPRPPQGLVFLHRMAKNFPPPQRPGTSNEQRCQQEEGALGVNIPEAVWQEGRWTCPAEC